MKPLVYLKGVYRELKKVKWPSQKQASYLTALVIALSIAIAYYLGLFDYIFSIIFEAYIM